MKDPIFLIFHLLTTLAKLLRPGGSRAIIAENLLLKHVNAYRIVRAINVYLLFALMGALTLEVIHATTGVSIDGNVVLTGTDEDYVHFIYFSLTSLTTVGFGDIYAVSIPAKMLAAFLSTVGTLFPAQIIARLVGLSFKPS